MKKLLSILLFAGLVAYFVYEEVQEALPVEEERVLTQPVQSLDANNANEVPTEEASPVAATTDSTRKTGVGTGTAVYDLLINGFRQTNRQALAVCSWNIRDLGRTKTDEQLDLMAEIMRNFDIVAVQEVVAGPAGPQAASKLAEILNRKGSRWDYRISEPTVGQGPERYAFYWKTARVKLLGKPELYLELRESLDREPYVGKFSFRDKEFTLVNFHAVPSSKSPETEIVQLDQIHQAILDDNVIILGDFNLPTKRSAFNRLKLAGYKPVMSGDRTSYRMKLDDEGNYLSQEYDNILFEKEVFQLVSSGVTDFYPVFNDLRETRRISDHLPVWAELIW